MFTEKSVIHIFQPSLPSDEHFTCFGTFIIINEQLLILVQHSSSHLIQISLIFDLSYFCSRMRSRTPHFIWSLCHLGLFSAVIGLRLALFLMILTLARSPSQVLCKMCISQDLFNVFLMSQLGLWVLGDKPTEVKFIFIIFYQRYMIQYQHDSSLLRLTLLSQLGLCLSGVSLWSYPFPCSPITLFRWKPLCTAHMSGVGRCALTPEGCDTCRSYLKILAWEIYLSSPIYLFIQLFMYIGSHS